MSQAYERVKGELETTKTQLKDAQDRLAAAKTLEDVEAAKAAIQKDYEAKLLERSIDAELIKAGCVNTKATQALIDITGIKLNGDVVEGLKVEDLAKQYPYLFSKVPTISTAAPSAGPADPAATERATYRAAAGLPPEKKE
ncbi:MAG: phage scaffolding protein [Coriobacteriales bacterium]|nr:phage scaffolding protein [Coriobacteriales bacterium]